MNAMNALNGNTANPVNPTQGDERGKVEAVARAVIQLQSRIDSGAVSRETGAKMLEFIARTHDVSPDIVNQIANNAGAVKKATGGLTKTGKDGQSRLGQFFESIGGMGDRISQYSKDHPAAFGVMAALASAPGSNKTKQGVHEVLRHNYDERRKERIEQESELTKRMKALAENKDKGGTWKQDTDGNWIYLTPDMSGQVKGLDTSQDSMWNTYWQAEKALGTSPQQAVKDYKLLSQDGEAGKVALANYQKAKVQDLINQFKRRTDTFGVIEQLKEGGLENRVINWLQQRNIIEGNPFLTDNNLDEAEVAIMSDLGVDRAMIDNIRVLRMNGATNQQIMEILKMELGGAQ